MLHVKYAREKKINNFSPIGFTLQLPKKKRKKEVVTANNCRSLLTQATHTKEKYKGKTRADNIYWEGTNKVYEKKKNKCTKGIKSYGSF